MSESTLTTHISAHTSLAAVGCLLCHQQVLAPIEQHVQIAQKTVRYSPIQKLRMALLLLLCGAHRLVEVNTTLRPDTGLLAAFGLEACAEQSVIQETLSACTSENVEEMQQALNLIYRSHSRGYGHDYQKQWQLLDIDLSGLPAGREAEGSKKGYFHGKHGQRGRQTGRVIATHYDEIVVERVYPGDTNLMPIFLELVEAAQETFQFTKEQRARTILRVDGGAGSVENINTCLEAGYHYHGKDYSHRRVERLVKSVNAWYDDPRFPGRQVGLVTASAAEYVRPVIRIALRHRDRKGVWRHQVLLSTLPKQAMLALSPPPQEAVAEAGLLLSYVYFYDARGGGVEGTFRQDNQALGRTCRNKKRLPAQQMLACLGALAHNILIWARQWLQPALPRLQGVGLLRLTRDVLSMSGCILTDATHRVLRLILPGRHPWARAFVQAWRQLYPNLALEVNLGEN